MYLILMFILKVLRCIFYQQNASFLCGLYESLIVHRFDTSPDILQKSGQESV